MSESVCGTCGQPVGEIHSYGCSHARGGYATVTQEHTNDELLIAWALLAREQERMYEKLREIENEMAQLPPAHSRSLRELAQQKLHEQERENGSWARRGIGT